MDVPVPVVVTVLLYVVEAVVVMTVAVVASVITYVIKTRRTISQNYRDIMKNI